MPLASVKVDVGGGLATRGKLVGVEVSGRLGGWPAHFVRVVWVLQAQPRSLRENESIVLFWQVVAATRGSIFTKRGQYLGR